MQMHNWKGQDLRASFSANTERGRFQGQVLTGTLGMKFTQQGTEVYTTDRGPFELSTGQIVFLPAEQRYQADFRETTQSVDGVCIDIGTAYWSALSWEYLHTHWLDRPLSIRGTQAEQRLQAVEVLGTTDVPATAWRLLPVLSELGHELYEGHARLASVLKKQDTVVENLALIYRARDYLAAHYRRPFRLAGLAAEVGVSPYRLARQFKLVFDCTPLNYHHQVRIQRAVPLLQQPLSLTEVAYQTGYESLSVFSKRFKQILGQAPSAYKKQDSAN